jgi:hypothetical protein
MNEFCKIIPKLQQNDPSEARTSSWRSHDPSFARTSSGLRPNDHDFAITLSSRQNPYRPLCGRRVGSAHIVALP